MYAKFDESYYRFKSQLRTKLSYQLALNNLIVPKEIKCPSCSKGKVAKFIQEETIEWNEHEMKVDLLGLRCNKCKETVYDGPALSIRELVCNYLKLL